MPDANVFTAQFEYDDAPEGYRSGEASAGQAVGGKDLSVRLYELPPGQSLCPYHYEYTEEWMLVLEGAVVVRSPEGEATAERGTLRCFPTGPSGAHKMTTARGRLHGCSCGQAPTSPPLPSIRTATRSASGRPTAQTR